MVAYSKPNIFLKLILYAFILFFIWVILFKIFGGVLLRSVILVKSPLLVNIVVNGGAPINAVDRNGNTPLILAAALGRGDQKLGATPSSLVCQLLAILIQHHANINAKNKWGVTALHCGVFANQLPTVLMLINHRANPNIQDSTGATPLFTAIRHKNIEIASQLLLFGANPNIRNYKDESPLAKVEAMPDTQLTLLLLQHNADVNARSKTGFTALHEAAYLNRVDNAELFIRYGADINARDYQMGATPLWEAASCGNTGMVKCLLEHGADSTIPIKAGNMTTPLEIARKEKHDAIVKLLIESINRWSNH